jgi:hypothetical protein
VRPGRPAAQVRSPPIGAPETALLRMRGGIEYSVPATGRAPIQLGRIDIQSSLSPKDAPVRLPRQSAAVPGHGSCSILPMSFAHGEERRNVAFV